MTRDELKKIFPDATDEQITNTLNSFNNEKNAAVKAVDKGVSDDDLKSLREKAKAYDEAEKAKMTVEEKYKALMQEAENARLEAAKIRSKTKAEAEFIKAGLTEAEYKDILDDVVAEDDEKTLAKVSRFTALLKAKTDAAVKTTTESLMKSGMQPKANNGGNDAEGAKGEDAAVTLAKSLAGSNTAPEKSAFEYYKK